MDNRNKHCALDDYFTSMFTEPTDVIVASEPETPALATVTVLRRDGTGTDTIETDAKASRYETPAAIPQVGYLEPARYPQAVSRPVTFAMPEPDESGTLKDLDQLLKSVIDIELENIDLSILDQEQAMALDAQHTAILDTGIQVQDQPTAELHAEIIAPLPEVIRSEENHRLQQDEVAAVTIQADTVPAVEWKNVELDERFQALFFEVAGVTFAVPLTELGGIHQTENINALFGKPDWFMGIMQYRESKLTVVDTAKWVMPEQDMGVIDYKYLVQLDGSNWALGCEKLLGNETLNRNDVKWRTMPGSRPWLAGMVKSRMCVLLHVTEMIKLLNNGINIHGQ